MAIAFSISTRKHISGESVNINKFSCFGNVIGTISSINTHISYYSCNNLIAFRPDGFSVLNTNNFSNYYLYPPPTIILIAYDKASSVSIPECLYTFDVSFGNM